MSHLKIAIKSDITFTWFKSSYVIDGNKILKRQYHKPQFSFNPVKYPNKNTVSNTNKVMN